MFNPLDRVLNHIGEDYQGRIAGSARHYVEVDIGREAEKLDLEEECQCYRGVLAVVPLKAPAPGMKVRIDGRTFVNYAQLESGVAVPGYVARNSQLPRKRFVANDSMILNC